MQVARFRYSLHQLEEPERDGSVMSSEKLFAALGLVACAVMLVRIGLGKRARSRLDGFIRQVWLDIAAGTSQIWARRSKRRIARQVMQEAIRRAQTKARGRWSGNVYMPDAFERRKDENKPPPDGDSSH